MSMKMKLIKSLIPISTVNEMVNDFVTDELKNDLIKQVMEYLHGKIESEFNGLSIGETEFKCISLTKTVDGLLIASPCVMSLENNEMFIRYILTSYNIETELQKQSIDFVKNYIAEKAKQIYES